MIKLSRGLFLDDIFPDTVDITHFYRQIQWKQYWKNLSCKQCENLYKRFIINDKYFDQNNSAKDRMTPNNSWENLKNIHHKYSKLKSKGESQCPMFH